MTTVDFITELFCRVDHAMQDVPKHPQAALYPVKSSLWPCSWRSRAGATAPSCAGLSATMASSFRACRSARASSACSKSTSSECAFSSPRRPF